MPGQDYRMGLTPVLTSVLLIHTGVDPIRYRVVFPVPVTEVPVTSLQLDQWRI